MYLLNLESRSQACRDLLGSLPFTSGLHYMITSYLVFVPNWLETSIVALKATAAWGVSAWHERECALGPGRLPATVVESSRAMTLGACVKYGSSGESGRTPLVDALVVA